MKGRLGGESDGNKGEGKLEALRRDIVRGEGKSEGTRAILKADGEGKVRGR